jgi:Deacetylase PdaC/Protein of unknown function (DUF3298)
MTNHQMNFRKALLFIVLGVAFTCCKEAPKPAAPAPEMTPPILTFTENHLKKAVGSCTAKDGSGSCVEIDVNYSSISKGPEVMHNAIEQWVERFMMDVTGAENTANAQPLTVNQSLDYLIKDHAAQIKENPSAYIKTWELNARDTVLYHSGTLLCARLDAYTNYGGAHPNYMSNIALFDPRNGQKIEGESLVLKKEALLKLLEEKYRLDKKEAFDTGFKFSEDQPFKLPENMGVTARGILFHYNTYEIASHAMGDCDIFLTWEQLKDMVKRVG